MATSVQIEEEVAARPPPAAAAAEEGTVTMGEVYAQLQSDARQAQVLAHRAGAKLNCCSYSLGAHSQPVYWCRTCHPAGQQVGICFGCSMNPGCHLDHQVEELFEKRAFTCDCGNAKAGGHCALQAEKAPENVDNVYNHNFAGEYCYCNGQYDAESDVMVNCILCQDWYHAASEGKPAGCIDATLPEAEGTADFVCRQCMANPKYSLLLPYFEMAVKAAAEAPSTSSANTPSMSRSVSLDHSAMEEAKEEPTTSAAAAAATTNATLIIPAASNSLETKEPEAVVETDASMQTPARKRKIDETLPNSAEATPASAAAASTAVTPAAGEAAAPIICSRPSAVANSASSSSSPVVDRFIPGSWNAYLCFCPACMAEYTERGLAWLVDEQETEHGDGRGEANLLGDMTDADANAPLEADFDSEALTASLIQNMPRATAIDVLTPFQLYQASIKRQLEEFAANHPAAVVTAEVIREITAQAKRESLDGAREMKRQRMNGEETLPE